MKKTLTLTCMIFIVALAGLSCYASDYFVSPNGSDTNPGTEASPFGTIQHAVDIVQPGDYIYLRGGTYSLSEKISMISTNNGTTGAYKHIFGYPGEWPVLDFSNQEFGSNNRGMQINGSYWYLKGIEIKNAGDNGLIIYGGSGGGNYNIIENCVFHHNDDSGFQISGGGGYNKIINCDSYANADPDVEDADGFAPKLDIGPGNEFYGCRAWNNSDDGWDMYEGQEPVLIENCWSFSNGYQEDGNLYPADADKNGFKVGGNGVAANHILKNCVAVGNGKNGFHQNHNTGNVTLYNCTSYNNDNLNYNFPEDVDGSHIFTNCISFQSGGSDRYDDVTQTTNSWQVASVSSADFQSLDAGQLKAARNADFTLPDISFLNLASGSEMIDAGTDVGIGYNGSAPDLGAFEFGGTVTPPPAGTTYILSTNVSGSGSVSPGSGTFDAGTIVSLTASASSGWIFDSWSGDVSGTSNPISITMNSNKAVTAVFVEEGTTPPPPTGELGDNLSITGPDPGADGSSKASGTSYGNVIDGDESTIWSPNSTSDERISVKWGSDVTCNTVIIHEITNSVTSYSIVNNDNGEILATGTTLGSGAQVSFADVTLKKINLVIHSASSIPQVTEFEVYNATGTVTPTTYSLITNVTGSGSVSPSSGTFDEGTVVTLIATPASGWAVSSWSGVDAGSGNSATVTMSSDRNVSVTFTEIQVPTYTLSTNVNGSGSVSPNSGTFEEGTSVTLSATPANGWQFDNWTGGVSGTNPTVTVVMNSNVSVTANFSEIPAGGTEITLQENETGFCDVDGVIESEHSGYTGSGYANTDNSTGTGIEYKVNVLSAGTYTIEIRYAATSDRPADLIQDGSVVASDIAMPSSGAWTNWNTATTSAYLSAGISDLRLEATGSNGLPNIDYLKLSGASISANDCNGSVPVVFTLSTDVNGSGSVSPNSGTFEEGTSVTLSATPANGWQFDNWTGGVSGTNPTVTVVMNSNVSVTANFSEIPAGGTEITLQENETGFCDVDGAIESEHSGYTGSGYANTDNSTGTGIDYKVNVLSAGTYTIEIRYAATSDRPADLIQDGSVVASDIAMPSSGAWTNWNTAATSAYLSAGISDLRLEATGSSGLPNIDYLMISGADIVIEDCSSNGGSTPVTYTLTTNVSPAGAGSLSVSPSGGVYEEGTIVTLTANANTDYSFSSWSGDASGTSSSTTVIMNSDLSATAIFNYIGGGSETPSFALVGWATQNGVTTGGSGGNTITVSTGTELQNALKDKQDISTPLTIIVNGTITTDNSEGLSKIDIKDVSDVSLIGDGGGAEFNGIGIKVTRASNIIIRNLKIHHVLIGDKDCISIEGPADHVWVDHCELYNEYDGVDKDYYDALLDIKAEAEYVTYSWNYLHDSWKTSLVGSSESDTYDRKITMHHNYYRNCYSRLPLFRGGNGHLFNNYFLNIHSTAINSRLGACIRIENNYFENVLNPYISAYSDELGGGELIGNILVNSPFEYSDEINEILTCNGYVPYSYSSVLNSAVSVRTLVPQYAGVGKLSDPVNYSTKVQNEVTNVNTTRKDRIEIDAYPNPFTGSTTIHFNLPEEQEVNFTLYDLTGRIVDIITNDIYPSGENELRYNNPGLKSGVYILVAENKAFIQNLKLIIE